MLAETFLIICIMFITVLGPSLGIAILGSAVIKALSRNPSSSSKIFWGMCILIVFLEAISIIALLIILQIFAKTG